MSFSGANNNLLYRQALSLNLFQHETRGCTLALDEKSSTLMLCYSGKYQQTSFQDFTNVLNNMIELCGTLCEQLAQSLHEEPTPVANEFSAFGILC